MTLGLANELWSELRRYISTVDREEATETLVNVLIDNGYDSTEIRDAFKGDADVKHILSAYMDDQGDEEEEEDEYQDFDEEY